MCAIFGSINHTDNLGMCLAGLISQQHRGQDWFGIALQNETVHVVKRKGLVTDPNNRVNLTAHTGSPVIGHNRYPTAGGSTEINAQPHLSRDGQTALCANGDIVPSSYKYWKAYVTEAGFKPLSDNDGELLLRLLELSLSRGWTLLDSIDLIQREVIGAFSALVIHQGKLIAFRDRRGIRPMVFGKTEDGACFVASETCALDAVGAESIEFIEPGEIRVIESDGTWKKYQRNERVQHAHCVFELLYFSFPTSEVFGISVSAFRERLGARLAKTVPENATLVIGVPDSSNNAAAGLANQTSLPFRFGLIRPHYQGRSFISPGKEAQAKVADQKLIPDRAILNDQDVVVVDDSIVRGTTSQRTIQKLRKAGANSIHLRIIAPKITDPCFYGIDTPTKGELIGANRTVAEINEYIGSDSLVFLTIEDLKEVIASFGKDPDGFCFACFNGQYPTKL